MFNLISCISSKLSILHISLYILLDNIYRNCVNASYTSSAIDNIKIARGQKEI